MKLPFPSKKSKQADSAEADSTPEEPKLSRSEKLAKHKELATHHGTEGAIDVAGWVDSRTNASGIYTALAARKVPKGTNWFYTLGSATMFIFAMQAITGVFLSMYYTPSATQAYASITHMTNEVFLGEFVRGLHKWGASLMIILIFLHMARTFFFGAYKYPRELNWVIGVVLLILTMVMGLTGYLLPFDQRSFWATIVANNITASGPVVGPYLADFLRAGPDFSATTLSRFYALHMMVVPGLIGALIGAHLFLVVKLGTTAPPWVRANRPKNAQRSELVAAGMASPDSAEVPVVAEAPVEAEPEAEAEAEVTEPPVDPASQELADGQATDEDAATGDTVTPDADSGAESEGTTDSDSESGEEASS